MTCVLGIRHEGGVLLAGDSVGAVPGWGIAQARRDPKAYNLNRRVAIAYTSSFRMGQILRYNLELPPIVDEIGDEKEDDLFQWAVEDFVPAIRESLKDHGYTRIENNKEEGGCFLLAVADRLFSIESDFQIAEPELPYLAAGAGAEIANGALFVMIGRIERLQADGERTAEEHARDIAQRALDASVEHNAYVRPPYKFALTS